MNYTEIVEKGIARMKELGAPLLRGAETASGTKKAREYLDALSFEQRLIDSAYARVQCDFFGTPLRAPIMTAALSGMKNIEPHALEVMARGIKRAGLAMWLGVGSSDELQAVIDTGVATVKVVKPYRDMVHLMKEVEDAVARGVISVGTDITYFFGGKVEERLIMEKVTGPRTLAELKQIISTVKIPFVIKGVLSTVDAVKAKEAGAKAIVVSNHGGRSVDHAVPPLKILPEIRKAVGKDMILLVDGSIQRGADVLKALALGADFAQVGMVFMVALAAAGEDGVAEMAEILAAELERAMSITGIPTLRDMTMDVIRFP
jgi:4-hydroxymandelate oxidase